MLRTYTWGPGVDNLLSLTVWSGGSGSTPTATYYPLKDHQNSIIALADASGNVVESYSYDAYGRTTIFDSSGTEIVTQSEAGGTTATTGESGNHQSAIGNRYLWQGREFDFTTGLYYFRARWYIPGTEDSSGRSLGVGRWLSKDPVGISGGLNLYAFCGNNPVNFVDPMGLDNFSLNGLGGYNSGGAGYGQNAPPRGIDSSGNVVGGGQFNGMVTAGLESSAIGLGTVGVLGAVSAVGALAGGETVTVFGATGTTITGEKAGIVAMAIAQLIKQLAEFVDKIHQPPKQEPAYRGDY